MTIRYALRMMRRSPGSTLIAVSSLALGIGANTAIFSLINALMLRSLPVRDPGQLVELLQKYPGEPRGNGYWSDASYHNIRDHNHVFSAVIAASTPSRFSVRADGLEAENAIGEYVAGNFFRDLGVEPKIGRPAQADGEAVIGWQYWKSRFNLDPSILGKRMFIQDVPFTIVGVTPSAFFGLQVGSVTDIWFPLPASASARLALLGRLKPGVSIQQARAEMNVLYQFTIEERSRNSTDPLVRQLKVEVEPAGAGLSRLRDQFSTPLLVLMALVGLLLSIACSNVAGLLLAQAAGRKKEMALRVSLGASRLRLIRQVLTEALMLSISGSLLGIFLAYFGARALVRILTSGRLIIGLSGPISIPFEPDLHILLFTAGSALLTGVLFGLAPAWNAFRSAPISSLRESGAIGETKVTRLFGRSLVAAQVAFSMALASAASMFIAHLWNLRHVDLGFRRDHVLLLTLDPSRSGYTGARLSIVYRDLIERFQTIPGVRSVSMSAPTPLSGAGASGFATVEGFEEKPEDRRYLSVAWIAPKYFETLGTPIVAGRDFNFEDAAHPRVAIVNMAMARYYFHGTDPLGKHFTLDHLTGGDNGRWYEIVGVVGDANYYDVREPIGRTIYLPAYQRGAVLAESFVLRTNVDPASLTGAVRHVVHDALKTVPVARVTTLADQVDATIVPERLIAALSGTFGALGALLAAIGLYALLAYTMARRTTELGIRMALGATGANIIRMVFVDALRMVLAGLAIGVPLAWAGKRAAVSVLQDPSLNGAFLIVFIAAGMISIALLAAYLPARHAAQVDPMETLRHE